MNAVFHIITQAIDGHRLLNVVDESGGRVVEPYLIYESDGGDMVLHGWQRSGGEIRDTRAGWCTIHLDDISVVEFMPGRFASPHPEYAMRRHGFKRVLYEVGQRRRVEPAAASPGRLATPRRRSPPRGRLARSNPRMRRQRD